VENAVRNFIEVKIAESMIKEKDVGFVILYTWKKINLTLSERSDR